MGEKSFSVAADDINFGVNSGGKIYLYMVLETLYMAEDSILNEESMQQFWVAKTLRIFRILVLGVNANKGDCS